MALKALYKPLHFENTIEPPAPQFTGHQWLQRGPQLICQSCPFEHSIFLDPNLIYTGLDEQGMPKFETLQ